MVHGFSTGNTLTNRVFERRSSGSGGGEAPHRSRLDN
jgi:hypothetical protein